MSTHRLYAVQPYCACNWEGAGQQKRTREQPRKNRSKSINPCLRTAKMDAPELDFGLHIETARLQEFLAKLYRSQEQICKRQEELAAALDDVMKRLQKGENGVEEQQQALQRLQENLFKLSDRHDALQRLRIEEKIERFDSHHSEFKGLQAQLAQFDSKVGAEKSLRQRVS